MKFKRGKNLRIIDKRSVFISPNTIIGDNVTIYENNRIDGNCVIENGAIIMPGCYLRDTKVGTGAVINNSQSENAVIGENCQVGPFARLRSGTILEKCVKIGNFVEVKNSIVGENTKISHLAYVGDADVGKNCNVGCGAIFVNYNGKTKNRTVVGDGCFIGSNCNIIAPVKIDDYSYICAGTTVTENVNKDDFVIGRVRQVVKENRAHKYLKGGI